MHEVWEFRAGSLFALYLFLFRSCAAIRWREGEGILQIRDEIVTSLWLASTYHHRPSSPEKICVMPFVPGDPPLLLYFAKEKR